MKSLLNLIAEVFQSEQKVSPNLNCPYGCGYTFEKMLTRRRKCPQCKKVIYASRLPFEKEKTLMSESDGESNALENEAFRILLNLEIATERSLKTRWGKSKSNHFFQDWASRVLADEFQRLQKTKEYSRLEIVCGELRNLLRKQGREEFFEILHVKFQAQLLGLKDAGFKRVKINTGGDDNEKLSGKRITISSALKTMPLPCGSDCGCYYTVDV